MNENYIYTSMALKLHAFGLEYLHESYCVDEMLYEKLMTHFKEKKEPTDLLIKTLKQGMLFHLGLWLYNLYVSDKEYLLSLDAEKKIIFFEDLHEMLLKYIEDIDNSGLKSLREKIKFLKDTYEDDSDDYFYSRDCENDVVKFHQEFIQFYKSELSSLSKIYAINYSQRVFHDRQLCEFIANIVVEICSSFPEDTLQKPIKRKTWPEWAKNAISARDRGKCSTCGTDLVLELDGNKNIDHIIPLAKGGNNDLVNLQLLCATCNNKKRDSIIAVKSSIPSYIQIIKKTPNK